MSGVSRSRIERYGIAVLCVATATAVRVLGWSSFDHEAPFLVFIAAQVVASWFGGLGPGIVACLLSTLAADYWLLPPYGQLAIPEGAYKIHLALFIAICILITWLVETLHVARERSVAAEKRSRQQAAEAEEGRRILETMMESLPIGVIIVDASDGKVRGISRSSGELTGRSRKALEGKPLGPELADWHQIYHEDGVTPASPEEIPLFRALRQGEVISGEEWVVKRPDGVMVPLLCDAVPIRDESGNIVQGLSTFYDITERKHSEQVLRQAHADMEARVRERTAELAIAVGRLEEEGRMLQLEKSKLLSILGAMPEAVYIVNQQYEIEYVNAAMVREFGPQTESKCFRYIHGEDSRCSWCRNEEVFAGQSVSSLLESPKNGKVYDVFDAPLVNYDGSLSKLKIMHDITGLKRAEEERARKQAQLESLWMLGGKIDASLEELYDSILSELLSMTQSRYAFFGFMNHDETVLSVHSWSEDAKRDCRIQGQAMEFSVAGGGLWAEAVRRREAMIVNEGLSNQPGSNGVPDGHVPLERLLVVPSVIRGRTVMLAALANKQEEYTGNDANQVGAFLTGVLAIIEKAKAEDALRKSREQLQRLSSQLLTVQEDERMRIAKELHDELGQALTLVKLSIGMVETKLHQDQSQIREHCEVASSAIAQMFETIRRISRDLSPPAIESLGITAALRRLVADAQKASRLSVSLALDDIDSLFSLRFRILLYRVFQESLTNIMRHSGASEVTISAHLQDGRVFFEVRDNGKGMDLQKLAERERAGESGMGLTTMRERVRTLGSTLEVWSQAGRGTRLGFSVPVEEEGGVK